MCCILLLLFAAFTPQLASLIGKKFKQVYINTWRLLYLKLWLGSAAEFGQNGQQRLVNRILCEFITVTLPALLQLLKASLTHGEQRQRYSQICPLSFGPWGVKCI